MNLILCNDLHLTSKQPQNRNDDILKTSLLKFEYIIQQAEKYDASILIAGDMFDIPRDWGLLPDIISLLKRYNVHIYAIYGQHDIYMRSEKNKHATNMGVLIKSGLVNLLIDIPIKLDKYHIYGCSWGKQIPKPENPNNILVIHHPIAQKKAYPEHNYYDSIDFLNDYPEYDLVVCGDVHRQFIDRIDDRYIINSGPIMRLKADEYNINYKPSVVLFDTNNKEIKQIPIPIKDNIFNTEKIKEKNQYDDMLSDFIIKMDKSIDNDTIDMIEIIKIWIEKNPDDTDLIKLLIETCKL
jgi:DNA repair exonuclease SbcCD nuclease subunit